ncbi:hypothetical protein EV378_4876 [Pseudonocardia endophytica]|uniref:Uncharacterized protein n=1 Tax=Pseudonocardia endophytica TaxID=401976 RepID=A0A4R1HKU5_PSEEN|nr:hypothetical protein EV378_4876 [Pseudonocardia endophytica]
MRRAVASRVADVVFVLAMLAAFALLLTRGQVLAWWGVL